jgi:hypothetical protein
MSLRYSITPKPFQPKVVSKSKQTNNGLKDVVERMDVEEDTSVESMEVEVIRDFFRVDHFAFNSSLVNSAFNNIVF